MTKLSSVADEARRVVGRVSAARLRSQGEALRALCAAHWLELRGPEPLASLAKLLWDTRPALADLFLGLCAAGDPRLAEILGRLSPARGLAMLVLAEIELGEAEEARCAYEAMMLYESMAVGDAQARRVRARLSGDGEPIDALHRHSTYSAIPKALAAIAAATGRRDLNAVVATIAFLAKRHAGTAEVANDESATRLFGTLTDLGVTFLGFDGERIHYELRGKERKAVARSRLARLLGEIAPT
jgi:hypothetical protein